MKLQRFRFRMIALLLIFLLGLAGFYVFRSVPFPAEQSTSGALREAILRLTGQSAPEPDPEASSLPAAVPVPTAEALPASDAPSVQPLSEALSNYFTSSSPVPDSAPVTETPVD